VATKKARSLLPEAVPHADAAWNAARAALLSIALTERPDLLFEATQDRLHQNYRRSAFPRSSDLLDKLRAAGIPAAISGAGPTVIAFASDQTNGVVAELAGARFSTDILHVDGEGTRVVPLDS
jgi:homoserine kinase